MATTGNYGEQVVAGRLTSGRLDAIQILRALAAIAVVTTHATTRTSMTLGSPSSSLFYLDGKQVTVGDVGVDLFFVISGFIMLYVHRADFATPGARGRFIEKRLTRIVPIYWTLTTLTLVIMVLAPSLLSRSSGVTDLRWVVGSYLFLPVPSPIGPIAPVVGVGWTLNYEMFFYVLFALVIGLPMRRALMVLFLTLGGLVFAGLWGSGDSRTPLGFFSSWLFIDFLAGLAIAWWVSSHGRLPAIVAWGAVGAGLCILAFTLATPPPEFERGYLRFLAWGLPSALIVLGACTLAVPRTPWARVGLLLGDASYSIYLGQFLAMPFWAAVLRKLGFSAVPFDLSVIALTALVVLSGVALWYFVERPLGRMLKGVAGLGNTRPALPR